MCLRPLASALVVLFAVTAAASAQNFGAIAYSPDTGGYGYSYDYRSQSEAESRALGECLSRTYGCVVAIWFQNACGAVAAGPNGWGTGWGSSQARADFEAISVCSQNSRGCVVQVQVCTSR